MRADFVALQHVLRAAPPCHLARLITPLSAILFTLFILLLPNLVNTPSKIPLHSGGYKNGAYTLRRSKIY